MHRIQVVWSHRLTIKNKKRRLTNLENRLSKTVLGIETGTDTKLGIVKVFMQRGMW